MPDSPTVIQAADVRAPSGASVPTLSLLLAGTGTTEATNTVALTGGEMATLLVGSVAIRVAWRATTGGGSSCALTDHVIGPYARFDWLVDAARDDFVAIEAADASSAYQAWLWTSSGPRSAT